MRYKKVSLLYILVVVITLLMIAVVIVVFKKRIRHMEDQGPGPVSSPVLIIIKHKIKRCETNSNALAFSRFTDAIC